MQHIHHMSNDMTVVVVVFVFVADLSCRARYLQNSQFPDWNDSLFLSPSSVFGLVFWATARLTDQTDAAREEVLGRESILPVGRWNAVSAAAQFV